jgi:hypothetical protein
MSFSQSYKNTVETFYTQEQYYQITTTQAPITDKKYAKHLSPVYLTTQSIYSFSQGSDLQFEYFSGTDQITGSVSVGGFSDPNLKTSTIITDTTITETITFPSVTGEQDEGVITYSGYFRTFDPSTYGKIEDVDLLTSYVLSGTPSEYSWYQYTYYNFSNTVETTTSDESETFPTSSTTFPSSIEIVSNQSVGTYQQFPAFFGGTDTISAPGFSSFYTSDVDNRSWHEQSLYLRISNAGEVGQSSQGTIYSETTKTSETGVFDSNGSLVTSSSWYYIISEGVLDTWESDNARGSDYVSSYSTKIYDYSISSLSMGAALHFKYYTTFCGDHWGFWDSSGNMTEVGAFVSPISLNGKNLENIGAAKHKNARIFFPGINEGDYGSPQTEYKVEVNELTDGLGISFDGVSVTWNTDGASTISGVFATSYAVETYQTQFTGGGNKQIPYPKDSIGNFPITMKWHGVFGATTFGESGSSSSIFTASTDVSVTGSSTVITLQENQTLQIVSDGYWMNPGSYTGIL